MKKTSLIAAALAVSAGGAQADQVILDDLIVDGSACIGFDCVNGESFGFDTIRIKENNLRIKAQDTSSSASFPTQDWQITFNETSNGGADKFSIDAISPKTSTPFTIEAGNKSHALYVDDGGKIGIGTSTPTVNLHVVTGNTPTLRLEQNGSSGFTPQTWDLAGNEANFFVRDATNGSTLPFRVFPGAPSNALTIEASGDVGVGTTSPDATLDIEADGPTLRLSNTGSGHAQWDLVMNGSTGRLNWTHDGGTTNPLKLGPNAVNNLLRVGDAAATDGTNEVNIDGNLIVSGTITPDYVFEPDYKLEPIEEHARYMWTNKHLPAVGGAVVDENGTHKVNVGARSQAMLEELEKAHIYIEQLNTEIKTMAEEKAQAIAALEARLSDLEQHLPR